MLSIFVGVIYGLVLAGLVSSLKKRYGAPSANRIAVSVGVGVVSTVMYIMVVRVGPLWGLAFVPLIAMLAIAGFAIEEHIRNGGDSYVEALLSSMVVSLATTEASAASSAIAEHMSLPSLARIVAILPVVFGGATIGYIWFDVFNYKALESAKPWLKYIGVAILALCVITNTVSLVLAGAGVVKTTTTTASTTNAPEFESSTIVMNDGNGYDDDYTAPPSVAQYDGGPMVTDQAEPGSTVGGGNNAAAYTGEATYEVENTTYASDGGSATSDWWHFYNLDLDSSDKLLFQNFGPDPMFSERAMVSIGDLLKEKGTNGTIKVEELLDRIGVDTLDAEFRERLRNDPALGAADMAWFDSVMGTRYLGSFYDEVDHAWDAAMNLAKSDWMKDPVDYANTLEAFFKYLDMAEKIEIRKDKGLTDQMYMNPFTTDGIPDIVVLESENQEGWFIVYSFTVKGTTVKEIKYRINCGFQPTNVAKVMNVKAGKNPNKKTDTGGSDGGGGGSTKKKTDTGSSSSTSPSSGGGSDSSKPKPTPSNNKKKDKTKGTSVLPNDTSGPGPNTNNGVGAQYSSEDEPTNSNHMTYNEYEHRMDVLEEINDTQQTPDNADNSPTYEPPASVTEDNNGDNGYGWGGADDPTPVHEDAHPVDNSPVTSSDGDGAWGGPPL